MQKNRYDIHFKENYDVDGVDEICETFPEAQQWYKDKRVRFYGTAERCQEFLRAVATVAEVEKTFTY